MKTLLKSMPVVVLACALCVLLVGCSSGPSTAVDNVLKAYKNDNEEVLKTAFVSEDDYIIDVTGRSATGESSLDPAVVDSFREKLYGFDYTIDGEIVKDDTATVQVTFKTYDFSPFVVGWMNDYITQATAAAYANLGADEETLTQMFTEIAADTLQARLPLLGEKNVTTTTTIQCQRIDGKWKVMKFSDEAANAMMGGYPSAAASEIDKIQARYGG